jgi:hypothetical protein
MISSHTGVPNSEFSFGGRALKPPLDGSGEGRKGLISRAETVGRLDSSPTTRQSVVMRFLLLSCLAFGIISSSAQDSVKLLPSAHAHNDYRHPHPLTDALSHGFQSVEADIFLIKGKLLVAHDLDEAKPANTLQALYFDPLQARVKKHGGKVYAESKEPFYLLIDLKSDGESTYRALHQVLIQYREMLTEFQDTAVERKAVTIIISGNRPKELLKSLKPRLAGRDGRLSDLATADPHFTPWISDNWQKHFQWKGQGEIPQADRDKLKALITQAHTRKLQVRFWAIPDQPEAWKLLHEHEVDFINTDQLEKLSAFLSQPGPKH